MPHGGKPECWALLALGGAARNATALAVGPADGVCVVGIGEGRVDGRAETFALGLLPRADVIGAGGTYRELVCVAWCVGFGFTVGCDGATVGSLPPQSDA